LEQVYVGHFDSKTDAVEYLMEKQAALWKKTNLIMIRIYLSNYLRDSFSALRSESLIHSSY